MYEGDQDPKILFSESTYIHYNLVLLMWMKMQRHDNQGPQGLLVQHKDVANKQLSIRQKIRQKQIALIVQFRWLKQN